MGALEEDDMGAVSLEGKADMRLTTAALISLVLLVTGCSNGDLDNDRRPAATGDTAKRSSSKESFSAESVAFAKAKADADAYEYRYVREDCFTTNDDHTLCRFFRGDGASSLTLFYDRAGVLVKANEVRNSKDVDVTSLIRAGTRPEG